MWLPPLGKHLAYCGCIHPWGGVFVKAFLLQGGQTPGVSPCHSVCLLVVAAGGVSVCVCLSVSLPAGLDKLSQPSRCLSLLCVCRSPPPQPPTLHGCSYLGFAISFPAPEPRMAALGQAGEMLPSDPRRSSPCLSLPLAAGLCLFISFFLCIEH